MRRCAERFGAQCIVVAVDAKRVPAERGRRTPAALGGLRPRRAHAHRHRRRRVGGARRPSWAPASSAHQHGPRRHPDGYDLELTRAVARAVDVPVIASGGVGTLEHLADGLTEGEADAVLAASIFHYGTYTIAAGQAVPRGARRAGAAGDGARRRARRRSTGVGARRERPRRVDLAGPDGRGRAVAGRPAGRRAPRVLSRPTPCTASAASSRPAVREALHRRQRPRRGQAAPGRLPDAWSCSRPRWRSGPGCSPPCAACCRGRSRCCCRTRRAWRSRRRAGAAPRARHVGRQGDDSWPRWACACPRGRRRRGCLGELPFPLLASSANPSGGEAPPAPWTRWTAACWPPATSSSTPGPLQRRGVHHRRPERVRRRRRLARPAPGDRWTKSGVAAAARGPTGKERATMRTLPFVQVDVFTDRPFAGNPLAVFPEAEGLTPCRCRPSPAR